MSSIYIARQPIYDRNMQLEGYELLFRSGEKERAQVDDADLATAAVLRNSFMDFGLGQLVGEKRAFINFTRNLLLGGEALPRSPAKVVLELPGDLDPNTEALAALRELRDKGYRFALDNFSYSEAWEPFLGLVEAVKLNIQDCPPKRLAADVARLSGRRLQLLALRVESREEYVRCRELGFELFQGFFFCRPEIVKSRRLPSSKHSTVQLLAQLQSPDSDLRQLERIISQDVALSYRLLRYLNSVQFGLVEKVDSIGHAISYLGLDSLRVWASIILLARIDDKPLELMKSSLVRARMCELLAGQAGQGEGHQFFMVGLLSILDALLDLPLDEAVADLPLAEPVQRALLELEGEAGEALRCVLCYERGEWEFVDLAPYPKELIAGSYLKAIEWAEKTSGAMAA